MEQRRHKQVADGETLRIYKRKNGVAVVRTVCCSCGLTHIDLFKDTKRYLRSIGYRDQEYTEFLRNRYKKWFYARGK